MTTYGLKGHKEMKGRGGYVMSGTVVLDSRTVATYYDAGNGGEMDVRYATAEERSRFVSHLATLPPVVMGDDSLPMDAAMFIGSLADDLAAQKKANRSKAVA
jgi:hypothetical protein